MKTDLLYVLVSDSGDYYLEQLYLSAVTAREKNPEARIVLLTDRLTMEGLRDRGPLGKAFKGLFDQIYPVDLSPSLSPMKRSRILKTGMRQYVPGDFLYIDADTLIARPLDDIDRNPAPLAACEDLHAHFDSHPHRDATLSLCRKLGFDASAEFSYFNGGVLLVRDTPVAHAFFRTWQKNYLEGLEAGIRQDQPSLAKTNALLGHPIVLMEDTWNCEVQNGVRFLKDAYIVHYMVTNVGTGDQKSLYLLNDNEVLQRVREAGGITEEVRAVMEDPLKGYARTTQVFAGNDDLFFFQTRRYRHLRRRFVRGRWSLLEFLLKVKDHLLPCRK